LTVGFTNWEETFLLETRTTRRGLEEVIALFLAL